jgi:V8-like Glu-specific endopeptidase
MKRARIAPTLRPDRGAAAAIALSLLLLPAGAAAAPTARLDDPEPFPAGVSGEEVAFHADSGPVANPGPALQQVYEIALGRGDATWVRVFFGPDTVVQPGGAIRITSLFDGAVQNLDAEALRQWRYSSAYFNGPMVIVELLAGPRTGGNRLTVERLFLGGDEPAAESICGTADDRVLSSDPRAGRMLSGGCTGWLVNECFLSAGHCMTGNTIVQFNVPLSSSTGSLNHPPPSDQYSIDTASRQFVNGGVGNDWGYFGVFPNTQTGLTALQAQGSRYILASNVNPPAGQTIRITGYGTDSSPATSNQVQQTHAGPYRELSGTIVRYEVDTTGGNSGSAVFDESQGRAIGIHTHAGCDSAPPPYNQGTSLTLASLQTALRNPAGRCANQAACNGNGVCESGEDCFNCVQDCIHQSPGSFCGNDVCETAAGENCTNCPPDCNSRTKGKPAGQYCCGTTATCDDPRCTGNGNTCSATSGGYCCGDALCEGAETTANCGVDCGP